MVEILIIISWWFIGGFDWINDIIENIFTIKQILLQNYNIWEPNYNSYDLWIQSMLEKDPSYEEGFLSRQEYIDGKYPNLNEIVDDDVIAYIQAELYGYEDEMN